MADVAAPSALPPTGRGGPFGALARAQYRALATIRWSIFRNTLRTSRGALEATAHGIGGEEEEVGLQFVAADGFDGGGGAR